MSASQDLLSSAIYFGKSVVEMRHGSIPSAVIVSVNSEELSRGCNVSCNALMVAGGTSRRANRAIHDAPATDGYPSSLKVGTCGAREERTS